MNTAEPIVQLHKVNKVYRGDGVETHVLFDIDLDIYPREFAAIVGASGSGKTTLLNIIGLLDTPTSGEVILNGRNVAQISDDERAALRRDYLGFIFQFHYLLPEFNVLDNALIPCKLRGESCGGETTERMIGLLDKVGLGERIYFRPNQLSGGQQQRVAIVRALANDPELVLADEPTGNLDSKAGRAVFDLMRDLNRTTGKAFLMVTHDESFAKQADRLVHIVDGRIED